MAKRGIKARPKAVAAALPEVPHDLTPSEAEEFTLLAEAARDAGTLPRVNVRTLKAAARCQVILDTAHATLEREGLTDVGGHGTTIAHPLLATIKAHTAQLRSLLRDLGLTPESSKLGDRRKGDDDDPWKGLLSVTG